MKDRMSMIYAILQTRLGNYRTERGAKLHMELSHKTDDELRAELERLQVRHETKSDRLYQALHNALCTADEESTKELRAAFEAYEKVSRSVRRIPFGRNVLDAIKEALEVGGPS